MNGNKSRKLRVIAKHIASQNEKINERKTYQNLKVGYYKELKTINN